MKPQGSATFLNNDSAMLGIALLTRDTRVPASQRLKIRDEVAAMSFDLAVSYRLLVFENERARLQAKLIAYEVSKIFDDGSGSDPGSNAWDDKYSDANTMVW